MKDIVGNHIKSGDIVCISESRDSYMSIMLVIESKPGSIKCVSIDIDYDWVQGKRSSSNVIKLLGPQVNILFQENPGKAKTCREKAKKFNIKIN